MFRSFARRGGVAVAAAAVGFAGMSLAFAGQAGAATPNASLIIGSGSQTSYDAMTGLSTVFNQAAGCDLTSGLGTAPLSLNCGGNSTTPGTPLGEQGFSVSSENPYNDFTVQAPAVGSGNGATQLIDAGKGTPDTAISYSRASSPKGDSTDNRVQYATDGQSWVTFNKVAGVATDQAKVTNMSSSDVKAIFNGTKSCTIKGVTYSMDWICEGAKTSSPIDVYIAQTGSGTFSTWSTWSGIPKVNPGGVVCAACEKGWPTPATAAAAHQNIPENQLASISTQPDAANAIYFYSYGRFNVTCPGGPKKANCRGTAKTDYATFGGIDGLVASTTTILGSGGGVGATWPVTRGIYNNYNNSSAVVPATDATLNFTSELGFLCKTGTTSDINPYTGNSFRTDIENAIKAAGFIPLDIAQTPFNEVPTGTTLTYPASISDPNYTAIDNASTASGFCLVTNG